MPITLVRDLSALAARTVDLLVVGGGIYGLTVACDAAQRGLSVALIEKGDFGSGTSFNHLRTIHGGLRYLQTLDIPRARESVRERRALARIAPWAIAPLPFVLPLTASLTRGPLAMRAGFMLDRLVAHDRNKGVSASHVLPGGTVLSADAARAQYPELRDLPMAGAARWFDYVTVEADRLTLAWGLAAAQAGAALANYVEATSLDLVDGRVRAVHATNGLTGSTFRIEARTVVLAAGGSINTLLGPARAAVTLPLLQAVNLVTTLPAPAAAIGGRSASGRNLFLVPWRGRALFGTWESPSTCEAGALTISDAHLESFIAELNQAFPSTPLQRSDVSLVHRGVVPAKMRPDGTPTLDGGERVHDHSTTGVANLISVAGTKYTTARSVAERIVDRVVSMQGRRAVCRTATTPLPHVDASGDALLRHAAQHEMVMTLADAVMRRTPLAVLGHPGRAALEHAADVVGDVLGWSPDRRAREVDALDRVFP